MVLIPNNGSGFFTAYAHLGSQIGVRVNQTDIRQGQVIGQVSPAHRNGA